MKRLLSLVVCLSSMNLMADPVRDGSIGPGIAVQPLGPNFVIDDSMGVRNGTALLHSFQLFDLDSTQTATFTGPANIGFVISRVTGGQASLLGGNVVSAISQADFFLLNPNGILLTNGASLDVDGSVFLSSADGITFDTGEMFSALPENPLPVMTISQPQFFSFLDANIGTLSLEGVSLALKDSTTLGLIGGDVTIDSSSVEIPSGRFQVTSVASAAELPVFGRPDISSLGGLGAITVSDTIVDVGGDAAGVILLQSDTLAVTDSEMNSGGVDTAALAVYAIDIEARTAISLQGESVFSATTEGDAAAGDILIVTDQFSLIDDSEIVSDTEGAGNAGSVIINANTVFIAGDAEIASDVEQGSSGDGGSVIISANSIELAGAPEISTDTDPDSSGAGGNIRLQARDTIVLDIEFEEDDEAGVLSNSEGLGNAGSISINSPVLRVDGGTINAMTDGPGAGGDIIVNADEVVLDNNGSISVQSTGSGDAGNIRLSGSGLVSINNNANISARATQANGGNIVVQGYQQIINRVGEVSANVNDGAGGNVQLDARQVVADNARIVAQAGNGQGGAININGDFFFNDNSLVSASAGPAGVSGTVTINAPEVDLSASLEAIPADYYNPSDLFRRACAARKTGEATGSFVITPTEFEPTSIEGWLPGVTVNTTPLGQQLLQVRQAVFGNVGNATNTVLETTLETMLEVQTALQDAGTQAGVASGLVHLARTYALLSVQETGASRRTLTMNASSLLQRAQQLVADDPRSLSYVLGNRAVLYAGNGQAQEALYLTRMAISAAEQSDTPASLFRWLALEGSLLAADGATIESIQSYRRATKVVGDSASARLALADASGNYFSQEILPVYQSLISLLLKQAKLEGIESAQQPYQEARLVMEALKAAELRDYYQDECVAELQASSLSIEDVSADVAIIYPIVLPHRLELLVSIDGLISHYSVDVDAVSLAGEVNELRELLENVEQGYLDAGQQLYDWVVAPYASELVSAGVETLVFINDGALRGLPIAAMYDGQQFLIEQYALAVAPSLNLVNPEPLSDDRRGVFLAGLSGSVQGFSALPGVPRELGAVAESMQGELGGKQNLNLNEAFNLDQIRDALSEQEPSIVHLATHASFGQRSDASFVLTWDGKLTMDRLAQYVQSTRFRERPLELLVLSACETAVGDARSGLGLAGIAVRAGARSAMGSLWTIADEATTELMIEFYTNLNDPELSRAQALRNAQLSLLADPTYAHPFFWSPFLMINNWL
jgi:filamentous hemagglutinin family protein